MRVDEIQNGVVIDHIPAGKGQMLYELLGLNALSCTVALIRNAVSAKTGKKDIIKIDADYPIKVDIVGYVSPEITVNRIVNGEIVERDQYLIVDSGNITITLSHNGEPYKLEMRAGNKALGQMKYDAIALTDGYTDARENEITLQLAPGYHTFLVTTQGRDMYRFVIYVMG